jgi:hypothetical protein
MARTRRVQWRNWSEWGASISGTSIVAVQTAVNPPKTKSTELIAGTGLSGFVMQSTGSFPFVCTIGTLLDWDITQPVLVGVDVLYFSSYVNGNLVVAASYKELAKGSGGSSVGLGTGYTALSGSPITYTIATTDPHPVIYSFESFQIPGGVLTSRSSGLSISVTLSGTSITADTNTAFLGLWYAWMPFDED